MNTLPPMNLIRTDLGVAVDLPSGPLPIRHIIGIGRNYAEHAREQGADLPQRPMIFTKNPAAACLDGDDIVIPPICRDPDTGGDQTDFEAELAVILAPPGFARATDRGSARSAPPRDIPEDRALDHILGYCCANDVSARWWQKHGSGGQFCRGKSFDTFCPLGPRLVPPDQIPDPQNLRIACRVNGRTMQDDTTANMTFPIARLIADLSRGTTLLPGTVILTGTPSGVGMARTPPVYLNHGDEVEIEIDKIGALRNRVVHGPA
jgi:2-keto-4-pentenoate hydratase/2-oxohepta-3-ene-1,7-dioic acid hydratase in catechol pathway